MKYFRPVLLAALVLVFSGAAFADDIHVIFDPPPTPVFLDPNNVFTPITSVDQPVFFTWGSCADDPYAPASIAGDEACANFANLTGQDLTTITFSFIADTTIPGADTVSCESIDPDLSQAQCPGGMFQTGDVVSTTFSGGTPIPPSPSKTNLSVFFLAENGVSPDDINKLGWSADVAEPSSLSLLGMSAGLLGLCLAFAKR